MLTKIINSSLDFLGIDKDLPISTIKNRLNKMHIELTNLDRTVRDVAKTNTVELIVWTFQSLESLEDLQATEKEALFILHLLTHGHESKN